MKLPRWLVIGMVAASILAVLVVPAFRWVTWPERTAYHFVDLMANRELDQANEMLSCGPAGPSREFRSVIEKPDEFFLEWAHARLKPKPRLLTDVVRGRARFLLPDGTRELFVERGAIAVEFGLDWTRELPYRTTEFGLPASDGRKK